ncbi:hypothetical protein N476_13365 [Pseudoalteromonas luteoviolacea H33]|uniref:Undecaprenyl-phosphate alpha-N-acetylglucosaminyl 1-phosphate transferase n=2 Tax=Pseudoalteromonas luteoviolacea TaxID=43657 RepID=A0A167EYN1_9GAMM|nr:hypothetical protein N476_13365 [Pseudoalteromonas luteoviolacea H33]KZN71458.1 hypothetical protein N477_04055 [Pseudoalteromonas luteoviolacea H33-S]
MNLYSVVIAFFSSFCTLYLLSSIAARIGLLDRPCERKQHVGAIPLIGGMSVFFAVSLALIIPLAQNQSLTLFLIAAGVIVFIGVLDDKYSLSVRSRLIGQTLVSAILIFGLDLYVVSLGNIIGFGDFYLGSVGKIFTIVAVIAAINAFNMIDGIDALLGGTGIVAFIALGLMSYMSGNFLVSSISFAFIAALIPYLLANLNMFPFRDKKVFMGDAGSMFIGLTVIWLVVYSIQDTKFGESAFRPVFALYILALPLMDMAAIMYRRIKKGNSPFSPDRDHIHHIFMRAGFTARQAALILVIVSSLIAALGLVFELMNTPDYVMLFVFLGIFCLYSYSIQHSFRLTKFFRRFLTMKNA